MRRYSANAPMPQRGANEVDRDAECTHHLRFACHATRTGRVQRAKSQAVSRVLEPNRTLRFSENGICYQLHQPASLTNCISRQTYPYNPDIQVQHPGALSDDNNGATLIRAGMRRTRLFHRICKLARPMETPLCRMIFLFLHQPWFNTTAKTIIYSK